MSDKKKADFRKFVQDSDLQDFYIYANSKFFKNQLPMVLVGYSYDKQDKDFHGCTLLLRGAKYAHYVTLNPLFKGWPKNECMVILHEMCHVKLNCTGGHGKKFKKEIRRLRDMGAFDPYL